MKDAGRTAKTATPRRSSTTQDDAGEDDAAAAGGTGSARCDPASEFVDIHSALELFSDASKLDGFVIADLRLSVDELEVFFAARSSDEDKCCNHDLYHAQRAKRSERFGAPTPLVTTDDDIETSPSVTGDGLQLYFARLNADFQPSLWRAVRSNTSAAFEDPVEIAGWLNGKYTREAPAVAASGRALFFSSLATGNGDLHRAELKDRELGADAKLAAVNGIGVEIAPVPSPREDILYFASDRVTDGQGELDIWVATRANARVPFSAARAVRELNTANTELPQWLSSDACRLIFSRQGEGGDTTLFVAERTP